MLERMSARDQLRVVASHKTQSPCAACTRRAARLTCPAHTAKSRRAGILPTGPHSARPVVSPTPALRPSSRISVWRVNATCTARAASSSSWLKGATPKTAMSVVPLLSVVISSSASRCTASRSAAWPGPPDAAAQAGRGRLWRRRERRRIPTVVLRNSASQSAWPASMRAKQTSGT